jgi:hypothetical protein
MNWKIPFLPTGDFPNLSWAGPNFPICDASGAAQDIEKNEALQNLTFPHVRQGCN